MNYGDIHYELQKQRGSASSQTCVSCGGRAQDWAYGYNGNPEIPRTLEHGPCSEDLFGCYQPMCVSCHRRHDIEKDEWLRSALQENGRRLAAAQTERLQNDPEFAEKRRELGRQVGLLPAGDAALESLKKARAVQTPEDQKKMGEHMGRTHSERLKNDPAYAEQHREYSRRNARARRKCSQCDLISHPPGIARHQRSSGHVGYTDA